ncbi:MAG: hypothetical protein OES57_03635 [Acidimicrobiia bacterium]|nr:hypothetical protein [Acidimicrobiia bacterium]
MNRSAVALLVGLVCLAVLIAVIATAEQRPLVVALEAVVIGLLTYALTFAVRPRGSSEERSVELD